MPTSRFSVVLCLAALLGLITISGCGGSTPAGTYELDKEAVKVSLEKAMADQASEDDPMAGMAAGMMSGLIESLSIKLVLNPDGTCTGDFSMMGDSKSSTGTWTHEGDQISVTMAMDSDKPETMTGTWTDQSLTFHPPEDEEMPFDLIFKRVNEG